MALTIAGARRGDGRAVLIGTAFSSMAALLAVHGLTTPGFLVGDNGLVAFSGARPCRWAARCLHSPRSPSCGDRAPYALCSSLQGSLLPAIVALGLVGILEPSFVPGVPEAASTPAYIVLGFGLVFYGALAVRAGRTFLLTRRIADLAVVYGLVLLGVALVPGLLMEYYELGWWLGHAWELIGIGLVGVPVALDLHRGAQSRPLAGDLRASELVSAADAFMGPTVRALLVRLAHKDEYTAKHTRGVALRAVQVGEELGLPPARLRELAIGGLVHDVGKLSVPNEILQKPGALTDAEYDRSSGTPSSAATSFASWASRHRWLAWSSTTTSGSTAAATPAGWARRTSTSRRGSWRSATSSTPCSRGGSTARPGRSRRPWSCSAGSPARRSTPRVSRPLSACSSASRTTPPARPLPERAVVRPGP